VHQLVNKTLIAARCTAQLWKKILQLVTLVFPQPQVCEHPVWIQDIKNYVIEVFLIINSYTTLYENWWLVLKV